MLKTAPKLLALAPLLALLYPVPAAGAANAEIDELRRQIEAARLEADAAVEIENLRLKTGLADLVIERGFFFPASPVAGRVAEMVFLGEARLVLEPPDDVEAGQLELFTGDPRLEEEVSEAVLVVAMDAAAEALFGRPPASDVDPGVRQRAEELFRRWRERPERRLLGVETGLLRDAWGDPLYDGFFAGWFRSEERGEFLYLFEPDEREQATLGQFTPVEATDKQKRRLARTLHRAQRRGRLLNLSVEDLGVWDTWLSASRLAADGTGSPGGRAFEPRHYALEVTLDSSLELAGKARLYLEPLSAVARVVRLDVHGDLVVSRVGDGAGRELAFHQVGDEVLVFLPQPPGKEEVEIEVDYSGRVLEKDGKHYALANTTHWYPHAGSVDLATYEASFRWPQKLDLVAGGERLEEGPAPGGMRTSRHRVDRPTFGFSFEVGKFRTESRRAGDVEITLAVDASARDLLDKASRAELLRSIADALGFLEETFGPYPLDELTVVTVPRAFSQSLLGFVTLSSLGVTDASLWTVLLGLEDRRTLIAHELAHQWWGHVVPWRSYRDQWLSEAMANYAAVLYARHRLADDRPAIGPTTGWQRDLTQTTVDGRPIESLGPLVLGERLVSSLSPDAYQAIVYKKGAVVLDMLSRVFGEETFLEILRAIVRAVAFRPVSTQDFVALVGKASGLELDPFARQFIYGTGLPEIYYTYRFEPQPDGTWKVWGRARQESPWRYHHRVIEKAGGRLDVERRRLDQIEVEASTLVVPLQIVVHKPDVAESRGRKRGEPERAGNAVLNARVLLQGETSEFELPSEFEPRELWLDARREVFGRFYNEQRYPKRMLYSQALDEAAAGRHREAEDLYRRALDAEVFTGRDEEMSRHARESAEDLLDARIRLELARLYLDQDRVDEARRAFDRVRDEASRETRRLVSDKLKLVEARLLVRGGEFDRAYRLLRKAIVRRGDLDSTEGLLLLAIAAHGAGHRDEIGELLERAEEKGAEVGLLRELAG